MKPFLKNILHTLVRSIYSIQGSFLSFTTRPIHAEHINQPPRPVLAAKKLAVIIQGPLKHEHSFTIETVKLYKKTLLPSSAIIVSTWEDEDSTTLQTLRDLGAHVVTAPYPENKGILHINYQIVSVRNGIEKAKALGAEYVLKTRTDTRINASNIEEFLCGTH